MEKTPTYYKICAFSVNYESVMFYSKCPPVSEKSWKKFCSEKMGGGQFYPLLRSDEAT